jgi:hypothetical protein
MIAMLADGGPAEAYAMTSMRPMQEKLGSSREDVAAVNWIVSVPAPAPGSPWSCAKAAGTGVLFHLLLRDKTVFTFRHAGPGPELSSDAITQDELEAFGSLLHSKLVRTVGVCASHPFAAALRARIDAVNAKLEGLGAGPHARVTTHVVPAKEP